MMSSFSNSAGKPVLLRTVKAVQDNKDYLGEIDGLIGDGDHGMNMNKGFSVFGERIFTKDISFSDGLSELGMILLNEIGGSMGPIYGTVFIEMGDVLDQHNEIDLAFFARSVDAGYTELLDIVDARVGDKTIVDTLAPVCDFLNRAAAEGESMADAMDGVIAAAKAGSESTKDMIARFGRASRLGERSIGVPDAGSVSCAVIFTAMAEGIKLLIK
jgi:dihydroxyacetone kinase-like protein